MERSNRHRCWTTEFCILAQTTNKSTLSIQCQAGKSGSSTLATTLWLHLLFMRTLFMLVRTTIGSTRWRLLTTQM